MDKKRQSVNATAAAKDKQPTPKLTPEILDQYRRIWEMENPTSEIPVETRESKITEALTLTGNQCLNKLIPMILSIRGTTYASNTYERYEDQFLTFESEHLLENLSKYNEKLYPARRPSDQGKHKNRVSPQERYELKKSLFGYLELVETEVQDYVRRLKELLELFDIVLDDKETRAEEMKYRIICFVGLAIDQWKYSANLIFLRHFRFDSAYVPLNNKPFFFGTKLFPMKLQIKFNIMKSKKNWKRTENQQLIYTVFQGFKKGLLPVREEKVVENLLEHARALSTQQSALSAEAVDCIERTCEELFDKLEYLDEWTNSRFGISAKSTIESNYSKYGALGELLRQVSPYYIVDKDGNVTQIEGSLSSQFYGYGHFRDWEPFEITGPWATSFDIYAKAAEAAHKSLFETPMSQPSCILEPMKVRIITKPKWNQYLCMKDIQKSWWRYLKNHHSGFFDLIGRPVNPSDVETVINGTPFDWWVVSGDYSAATDNLKMEVTETILKSMMRIKDFRLYQMCRNALTGGEIEYNFEKCIPNSDWRNWESAFQAFKHIFDKYTDLPIIHGESGSLLKISQKNGQLMGSIISFILLCVANLSAYRFAIEKHERRKVSLKYIKEKRPVKINGDDILFSCEKQFYKVWCETITEFGFKPSPGKNLYHQDYCQINSVLYRIERIVSAPLQGSKSPMMALEKSFLPNLAIAHEIPYVNFGLMCNRKKQDCEVDTTIHIVDLDVLNSSLVGRIKTVKKIQETLLDGLTINLQSRANRIFYRHQTPWLESCFPQLNPFLSVHDGGFGLSDVGIEIEETRAMGRVRRKLKAWAEVSGRTLSSYLLGEKAEDRMISLLKEKAGNYFPSMRIRFSDDEAINPFGTKSAEEPEYSPTNRWWRLLKKKVPTVIRKQIVDNEDWSDYWGRICQERVEAELKVTYSEPHLGPLKHKRIVRFDSCDNTSYMEALEHLMGSKAEVGQV